MHYKVYELDQYRCRAMPWFRRMICRFHLRRCPRCRKRLLRLEQDDALISDLRKSTREMNVPENPDEYHTLRGLFQDDSDGRG